MLWFIFHSFFCLLPPFLWVNLAPGITGVRDGATFAQFSFNDWEATDSGSSFFLYLTERGPPFILKFSDGVALLFGWFFLVACNTAGVAESGGGLLTTGIHLFFFAALLERMTTTLVNTPP